MPSLQLWGWGEMNKCLIGISSAGGWVRQSAMSKGRLEGRLWDCPAVISPSMAHLVPDTVVDRIVSHLCVKIGCEPGYTELQTVHP